MSILARPGRGCRLREEYPEGHACRRGTPCVATWRPGSKSCMFPLDSPSLDALRGHLVGWGRSWGLPGLHRQLRLRVSPRLRTSLGSYRAAQGELILAEWLLDGPEALLEEVLGHEAAHAAVHAMHGRGARPHGPEWRSLMEQAGLPARVQVPGSALPPGRRPAAARRALWEHRCPVCQATRFARTRVGRWRCRACREAGRDGKLVVRRLQGAVGIDA
jgi:predicted SprT family Zn-dependent metalloprotease